MNADTCTTLMDAQSSQDYLEFLRAKIVVAAAQGFAVSDGEINPILLPHQRAIVRWAIAGGRRAIFAAFGLGKTIIQLEIVRLVMSRAGGMGLIVTPLGVRQEFMADARLLATGESAHVTDEQRAVLRAWIEADPARIPVVEFIRRTEEAVSERVIYLTNFESVREGKLDPRVFVVSSLDEAAVLRGFGGTKTFREFMRLFAGDDRGTGIKTEGVRYRFVATAVPSPNEHIELLAYAAYLEVMEVGQAKTRFFKRNSEKADKLTIHPHKEEEFWVWIATWALFVTKPSDIDPEFSDAGYELPPLDVRWHEIPGDHRNAGTEKDGQGRLFQTAAIGVQDAARVKRDSLPARIGKLLDIRAEATGEHRIIWHDLEAERHAIKSAIPSVVCIYGSQDLDERETAVTAFSNGEVPELAGKPVMLGSGCNFQRYCAWSVFLGIGFKFSDFIQAVHRTYRFLQTRQVRVDLIYTEAERDVRRQLERKWKQHNELVKRMTEIIREFGLAHAAAAAQLARSLGVERVEASGEGYRCINNDCVLETQEMPDDSIDLIVTSIPFANQYEYTPSFNDFGHTDDNEHFWEQMDFLTPQLLRVLKPGRIAAIHVKDRITPGGINGLGFQTVTRVSDECAAHFERHGFAFLGRKTIVTDVVRENNQTYRLGWSEQCKDGSRMGAGMPEYLLIFRKPPSDPTNGYADEPVAKDKAVYTRPRWQFDAHGFARSSGDRFLRPEELEGLTQAQIFRLFRKHSLESVYDFRQDVRIAEAVDKTGWLPSTFMLLQPQSWHPDVWTDITRMRTLNGSQAAKGKEMHICPLQFDIVDRAIEQYTMVGETVLDPFGGLMTVPYCALKLGRRGVGIELNARYWLDGVAYCESVVRDVSMPSLFDFGDIEATEVDSDAGAVCQ